MSANAVSVAPENQVSEKKSNPWVTVAIVLAIIALMVIPVLMHGLDAEFAGTDGIGTEVLEDGGVEPWFEFPAIASGELESGLFALQAALGAGVLGYAFGVIRERKRNKEITAALKESAVADLPNA